MANCDTRWAVDCTVPRHVRLTKYTTLTSDGSEQALFDENFFSNFVKVLANPKDEIITVMGYNDKFQLRSVTLPGSVGGDLFPAQASTPAALVCSCGTSYTPSQEFSDLLEALMECINSCCGGAGTGYVLSC